MNTAPHARWRLVINDGLLSGKCVWLVGVGASSRLSDAAIHQRSRPCRRLSPANDCRRRTLISSARSANGLFKADSRSTRRIATDAFGEGSRSRVRVGCRKAVEQLVCCPGAGAKPFTIFGKRGEMMGKRAQSAANPRQPWRCGRHPLSPRRRRRNRRSSAARAVSVFRICLWDERSWQ